MKLNNILYRDVYLPASMKVTGIKHRIQRYVTVFTEHGRGRNERSKIIGAYLVDKITLRMDKGNDQWQEPNTLQDVTVKAFIDYGERRIENAMGEVVVSMAKVLMRPRTIITSGFSTRALNTISYKDTIVFDGITHAIVRISKSRDFSVRSLDVYVA